MKIDFSGCFFFFILRTDCLVAATWRGKKQTSKNPHCEKVIKPYIQLRFRKFLRFGEFKQADQLALHRQWVVLKDKACRQGIEIVCKVKML